MKTSWMCRAFGICLGVLVPALGYSQEPFYNAPNVDYTQAGSQYRPIQEQPPRYFAEPEQPQTFPPIDTVSATSYYNLLERVEALENNAAKEACQEVDIISKPTQKWTGRIQLDYWNFPNESALPNYLDTGNANDGPDDFIGFRRIRLGINGNLSETMIYKSEFDFNTPNNLSFKDVYFGWNDLPFLRTLLVGNQKRPYGFDQLNSSRYTVFMERSYVLDAFNPDARRVGIQSYGVSQDLAWNWRYGYNLMNDLQHVGSQRTDAYHSELAGRLANTIWYDETSGGRGYAHWAISGSAAFPGGDGNDRFATRPESRTGSKWIDTGVLGASNYQLIGLEGVLNIGAFSLVGEYLTVHADRSAASDVNFGGGYLYTTYWLTGEHSPWDRKSGTLARPKPYEDFWMVKRRGGGRSYGWGAWQVAARYSYADFTDANVFGGVGESLTLGLNWWWNSHSRVQLNYINGRISDRIVAGGPSTSGWYDMIGMRFAVDF